MLTPSLFLHPTSLSDLFHSLSGQIRADFGLHCSISDSGVSYASDYHRQCWELRSEQDGSPALTWMALFATEFPSAKFFRDATGGMGVSCNVYACARLLRFGPTLDNWQLALGCFLLPPCLHTCASVSHRYLLLPLTRDSKNAHSCTSQAAWTGPAGEGRLRKPYTPRPATTT